MTNIHKKINWVLIATILLIPACILLFNTLGYNVYIVDSEKYPWIINTETAIRLDSIGKSIPLDLLTELKKEGLVLSPQQFTNYTHSYFAWLLTILVAVVGIIILIFGYNINAKIEHSVDSTLKQKWLDLMKNDKEVDSTIGGIIDEKVDESISLLADKVDEINKSLEILRSNTSILEND